MLKINAKQAFGKRTVINVRTAVEEFGLNHTLSMFDHVIGSSLKDAVCILDQLHTQVFGEPLPEKITKSAPRAAIIPAYNELAKKGLCPDDYIFEMTLTEFYRKKDHIVKEMRLDETEPASQSDADTGTTEQDVVEDRSILDEMIDQLADRFDAAFKSHFDSYETPIHLVNRFANDYETFMKVSAVEEVVRNGTAKYLMLDVGDAYVVFTSDEDPRVVVRGGGSSWVQEDRVLNFLEEMILGQFDLGLLRDDLIQTIAGTDYLHNLDRDDRVDEVRIARLMKFKAKQGVWPDKVIDAQERLKYSVKSRIALYWNLIDSVKPR